MSDELSYSFNAVTNLEVEVLVGDVTLTDAEVSHTETSGPVAVRLLPRGSHGHELARDFVVEQVGSTVRVVAPKGPKGLWGLVSKGSVDVEIVLSHLVAPKVRTGSGQISGHGRLGVVDLGTGSGDVTLDECGGGSVKSGSGDITVTQSTGDLRGKTGSGDVRVSRCPSDVDVATGSGSIVVERVEGRLRVKTGSGDICVGATPADLDAMTGSGDVRVESVLGGRNRIRTGSGDVSIGIARGVAALLDLHTVTGDVRNELDCSAGPEADDTRAEVIVNCGSGDITLRRAADAGAHTP